MPAFFSKLSGTLLIPGVYLLIGLIWIAGAEALVTNWLQTFWPDPQLWKQGVSLIGMTALLLVLVQWQQHHQQPSKAEIALRQSEERYRQAVENSPNPIFSVDRQGLIQTWNRACEQVYQYSQEMIGQPYSQLLVPNKRNKTITASVATVFAGNTLTGVEVVYCCRSGSERFMVSRLYPVLNQYGQVERCVFANTDITARHEAETNLQLLNQELEARVEQRTAELKASLEEKELLLREVHHRVKNNLQVISSLFSLQSQSIDDPIVLSILADSQNRINTMALIHEKLYQSTSLSQIDFRDYIRNLVTDLIAAANLSTHQIELHLEVSDIALDLDIAIRCGLIINELISNALKHAFPNGRAGKISLSFIPDSEGQLQLQVQDTGVGLPPDLQVRITHSLGLRLVRILVRKLKGNLTISNQVGASFEIVFPQP